MSGVACDGTGHRRKELQEIHSPDSVNLWYERQAEVNLPVRKGKLSSPGIDRITKHLLSCARC